MPLLVLAEKLRGLTRADVGDSAFVIDYQNRLTHVVQQLMAIVSLDTQLALAVADGIGHFVETQNELPDFVEGRSIDGHRLPVSQLDHRGQ